VRGSWEMKATNDGLQKGDTDCRLNVPTFLTEALCLLATDLRWRLLLFPKQTNNIPFDVSRPPTGVIATVSSGPNAADAHHAVLAPL